MGSLFAHFQVQARLAVRHVVTVSLHAVLCNYLIFFAYMLLQAILADLSDLPGVVAKTLLSQRLKCLQQSTVAAVNCAFANRSGRFWCYF